jgi:hypothetical protein
LQFENYGHFPPKSMTEMQKFRNRDGEPLEEIPADPTHSAHLLYFCRPVW